MPKIYLSPAYHKWNSCAIAGCDETTHNNAYIDELEPFLKACGIEYKRGTRRVPKSNENGTALMKKAIAESNAWKPDIHYVSHTNAGGGKTRGYRPMIYPGSTQGRKLADCIIKYRKEIYDQPIKLSETSEWAELRETKSVAYYEEHVFHDNLADAQWFHNNLRNIARQTCKGFCEYFGIKFVDPYDGTTETPVPQPTPTPASTPTTNTKVNVYYKVRTGGRWLSEVRNLEDYAGLTGNGITDIAIRVDRGSVKYRVHVKGSGWLPYVTGYNINDHKNGYAGNAKPIDAVEIYYNTPDDIRPYKVARYRVSSLNCGYYSWQIDNNKSQQMDGYAGSFGKVIDRIQIEIV